MCKEVSMSLSENLYNLRRNKGLSQEALAEKLNCSRQVISKWENGTSTPDAEMLKKYSELFCVSIDYLVKEDINHDLSVSMFFIIKDKFATIKKARNFRTRSYKLFSL